MYRISFLKFIIGLIIITLFMLPNDYIQAHSSLEKVNIKDGAQLEKSPKTLEFWFLDPVTIHSNSVVIKDEEGQRVSIEKPVIDPNDKTHIIVKFTEPLEHGDYTVRMEAIALDGDVFNESLKFTVLESPDVVQAQLNLVQTSPKDGEIVSESINEMSLWFNQPAELSMIGIFDDRRQQVTVTEITQDSEDPKRIRVTFDQSLQPGTYQVSWFSKPDKNAEGFVGDRMGIYYFAVKEYTAINAGSGEPIRDWFKNINGKQMSYWLAFIGLCLLVGGSIFQRFINKELATKNWRIISWILVGITGIGLSLYLFYQRSEIPNISKTEFFSLKISWLPIVQFTLLLLGMWIKRMGYLFFAVSMVLFSFYVGHSSYPRYGGGLSMTVNALHLLAVAVWFGGVFGLLLLSPKSNKFEWFKDKGKAFSKWAMFSIIVIMVTGLWMTGKYVPSFSVSSFVESVWGRSLVIKIGLFLLIILIGFLQSRSLRSFSEKKASIFKIRLGIEGLYGLLILFFAAILVVATPSAAEQGVYPDQVIRGGVSVTTHVTPLVPGYSEITITFDGPEKMEEVIIKLEMPPSWEKTNRAFKISEGVYKITGLNIHAAGTTNMEVQAKDENGKVLTFPFKIVSPGEIRFNE